LDLLPLPSKVPSCKETVPTPDYKLRFLRSYLK
jgi:hypothetical protein